MYVCLCVGERRVQKGYSEHNDKNDKIRHTTSPVLTLAPSKDTENNGALSLSLLFYQLPTFRPASRESPGTATCSHALLAATDGHVTGGWMPLQSRKNRRITPRWLLFRQTFYHYLPIAGRPPPPLPRLNRGKRERRVEIKLVGCRRKYTYNCNYGHSKDMMAAAFLYDL